jgi:hypothetical protein
MQLQEQGIRRRRTNSADKMAPACCVATLHAM